MKIRFGLPLFLVMLFACFSGCGVYSLTGASITGKTINIRTLENRALNVVPTLSPSLTDKLRNRILSQTGLAAVNTETADYDVKGVISGYNVSISGLQGTTQASNNRLTISVDVTFTNRLDEKASFKQTFSRFSDFSANEQLQSVEGRLIEDIGNQLADDIFNKAFVNW